MATFSKRLLSGSTNGRMIKIAATATPGTLIHTAVAGTVDFDEVWLWAQNNHTAEIQMSIEFGGTTSPDDLITVVVPAKEGLFHVVPGLPLNNGLVIRAFAATGNQLSIVGFVNRITAT